MVDSNFKKAVENKEIVNTRDFLRMRLSLDHNYVSGIFIECYNYCLSHGIPEEALYEKFDERALPSANTEENFNKLLGQLSTNFAKERVERLLKIGQAVWPEEQGSAQKTERSFTRGEASIQSAVKETSERRKISEVPIPSSEDNKPDRQEAVSSGRRIISQKLISVSQDNDTTQSFDRQNTEGTDARTKTEQSSHSSDSTVNATAIIAAAAVAAIIIIVAIAFGCSK